MNNNLPQLYTAHTDLVMARLRSPKVKDTDEPRAQELLAKCIEGVCVIRGAQVDKAGIGLMAALLAGQMRQDAPVADMTWEEVAKALQDGAFGKYGEVYGINAASLYDMLWGYLQGEERAELNRKVRELLTGAERKRQEQVQRFLEEHPAYAAIIKKNAEFFNQQK